MFNIKNGKSISYPDNVPDWANIFLADSAEEDEKFFSLGYKLIGGTYYGNTERHVWHRKRDE